jgi:endonuclease G, mitochondrial
MKIKSLLYFLLFPFCLFAQDFEDLPIFKNGEIIHHRHYSFEFSNKHKQAAWVAYRLDKSELLGPHKRKDDFRIDSLVTTGTATNNDYAKTGYDRGHLMPAEDATFCDTAMSETFFFSNMSPQNGRFNSGQWRSLENAVRVWAYHFDSLFVITAPILNEFIDTIGVENIIPVPKYYYKALYAFTPTDTHTIAFILPNQKVKSFKNHFTTIDSLERHAEINFFPLTVPEKYEVVTNPDFWFNILKTTKLPAKKRTIKTETVSVQCSGITSKGNRCKNNTTNDNGLCHLHQVKK